MTRPAQPPGYWVRLAALMGACLAFAGLAAACSCVVEEALDAATDAGVGSDAGADARTDARADATPRPDAAPWPDAAPIWDAGPGVDAVPGSLVQLPPSGLNEMMGVGFEYPYVAYAEDRSGTLNYDLYLYDLVSATEIPVCTLPSKQYAPRIANGLLIWSDNRYTVPGGDLVEEVFGYHIATGVTEQLTSDGYAKRLLDVSDTHILYYTNEGSPPHEGFSTLMLESLVTGEKRLLCEYIYGPQGASLSHTHVAWAALDPTNGWANRSVFLHDIAANNTQLLPSTTPGNVGTTDLSGDWLVWDDDRFGNLDVFAYRISTGQEQRVTEEPHDQTVPRVGGSLVVFMDFRYTGGSFVQWQTPNDLVVKDLETGAWRKMTFWSARWAPFGRPQVGWEVFIRGTGDHSYEVWAMDLMANQLVDATGHVIPPP